jgi:hypothetical protein
VTGSRAFLVMVTVIVGAHAILTISVLLVIFPRSTAQYSGWFE